MTPNIYILVASLLLLAYALGKVLRRIGLTEVLAYLVAGVIIGPALHFSAPEGFGSVVTGITLAFVAYTVGLSFSFSFLRRMGKKVLTILVVEVIVTSVSVWIFTYLVTRDLPLSIILASLAPATAPAGTLAVFRDLRSRGTLTDVSVAVVGLDDGAAIVIYSLGSTVTKTLLGGGVGLFESIAHPLWEIVGAVLLGAAIGLVLSYYSRRTRLSSDQIFVLCVSVSMMTWGVSQMMGVSSILACMVLGMTMINFSGRVGNRSNALIDNVMTPIFMLFFAAIGMQINFSQLGSIWLVVVMYCVGRSVGKVMGCGLGGFLSKSEAKITKYLGIALLNQAGVAVGLAFLAAEELSGYAMGGIIITLMASTTAIFQLFSPLGTQYAVKKAGEGNA